MEASFLISVFNIIFSSSHDVIKGIFVISGFRISGIAEILEADLEIRSFSDLRDTKALHTLVKLLDQSVSLRFLKRHTGSLHKEHGKIFFFQILHTPSMMFGLIFTRFHIRLCL
jgi:hypothetical protein